MNQILTALGLIVLLSFASVQAQNVSDDISVEKSQSIYLFSNIQGREKLLNDTLLAHKIINEKGEWQTSNTELVLLGDLTSSKEPQTARLIEKIKLLQATAMQNNNALTIVLSDEDIDYILKNAHLIDKENAIDFSWLTKQDFIVTRLGQVFTNGGLSFRVQDKNIKQINQQLKQELSAYIKGWNSLIAVNSEIANVEYKERFSATEKLKDSKEKALFLNEKMAKIQSKFWPHRYTGNSFCHPVIEEKNVTPLLERLSLKRIWSASSEFEKNGIKQRFNNKQIFIDVANQLAENKNILWGAKINNDNTYQLLAGEKTLTTKPSHLSQRFYNYPYQLTADDVKRDLVDAKIVRKKQTKEGRTKPTKLYLNKEGRDLKGIFKSVHQVRRNKQRGVPRTGDSYQFELAAYHLSEMLGLGVVPVTVERTIDNRRGAVQMWVEGLTSGIAMSDGKTSYSGMCELLAQEHFINSFDYLVKNFDRNQSNIMFTTNDWQIWFIDHTRAFGLGTSVPPLMRGIKIIPTQAFKERLRALKRSDLDSLKKWLRDSQIEGIWARRNRMLESEFILDD